MTPGARLSAAIGLLDQIIAGEPAEKALTRWSRSSRYAGSKDRAAVRDWVYDGLRRRRSLGWSGGGDTGRGIIIAAAYEAYDDPESLFTGTGFDSSPLTQREMVALGHGTADAPEAVKWDVPDFLLGELKNSLGEDLPGILEAMQKRAPVDLRVNSLKSNSDAATVVLARDGIHAVPHALARGALRVSENPRLLNASRAYSQGMVELQDVSSQFAAQFAGATPGTRVLDYCAGGGGKSLALASQMKGQGELFAWDVNPRRMNDLPARAQRAGANVRILSVDDLKSLGASCDVVFVDAPCTGTGAWRRNPDSKWRLTRKMVDSFPPLQDKVLDNASRHVKGGGRLIYATCSMLRRENEDRVEAFLERNPGWLLESLRRLSPLDAGDGFFVARLVAPESNS